jgi:DNA-binding beta-propeller fold protein YncE
MSRSTRPSAAAVLAIATLDKAAGAFFPAGLAYGQTPPGSRLYATGNLGATAGGAAGNPPGHTVSVIGPDSGAVTKTIELGQPLAPLGVTFAAAGKKADVTNWLGRRTARRRRWRRGGTSRRPTRRPRSR